MASMLTKRTLNLLLSLPPRKQSHRAEAMGKGRGLATAYHSASRPSQGCDLPAGPRVVGTQSRILSAALSQLETCYRYKL